MRTSLITIVIIAFLCIQGCSHAGPSTKDFRDLSVENKQQLQLSTYITAHTVRQMFETEAGRREVVSLLHCYGISKVYLEVYRSGLVISPSLIRESVLFLKENGFEVTGGIATVPGEGFGKVQDGPLGWFNWQNSKTQYDLRKVIEDAAPFFDTFIVDDFLCTSDTSTESKRAKGERTWTEYRRSLLTELAQSVIINPAKEKNPGIRVIIKYPQWYDRFHLFGYDVTAETKLFDGIWVGTESRGQYTQRFGFVQPYEGFINYRWLSSVAGNKTGGAWFDHEDCTDQGFLLCPRRIGLSVLPQWWVNTIRVSFCTEADPMIDAPTGVAFQNLSDNGFVIQNYNEDKVSVHIMFPQAADLKEEFTGRKISSGRQNIELEMKPRSHIWISKQ